MIIKNAPNGNDNKLFSNTIETSFREPELVTAFAVSIIRRRVSCLQSTNVNVNTQIIHMDVTILHFNYDLKDIMYS